MVERHRFNGLPHVALICGALVGGCNSSGLMLGGNERPLADLSFGDGHQITDLDIDLADRIDPSVDLTMDDADDSGDLLAGADLAPPDSFIACVAGAPCDTSPDIGG